MVIYVFTVLTCVRLLIGWVVSRITQKLQNKFIQIYNVGGVLAQNRSQ